MACVKNWMEKKVADMKRAGYSIDEIVDRTKYDKDFVVAIAGSNWDYDRMLIEQLEKEGKTFKYIMETVGVSAEEVADVIGVKVVRR